MLLIPTQLKKSEVHGLGVFSGKNIKKGELIWEEDPRGSLVLTEEELNDLSKVPKVRNLYFKHCSISKNQYYLELDHCRFLNHSDNSNTKYIEVDGKGIMIATRDIAEYEELFCNYTEINDVDRFKSWT